jgi:hypothetical protein
VETDTPGQEYRVEMESEAASALAEADNLREAARLEDLHLWKMENEFYSRKGRKKYEYWLDSWRRGSKIHNEVSGHLQEAQ